MSFKKALKNITKGGKYGEDEEESTFPGKGRKQAPKKGQKPKKVK